MSKKPKLLITGTGGFLMGNFVRRAIFNKAEYSFVSIDKVKKNQALNNIYTNKNHEFYIGDISNDHFVNVIFESERPDIVVHGASSSEGPILQDNIIGTQAVIEACQKWGVKRLLYISTDKVYPNNPGADLTETTCPAPRCLYAASKASGELIAQIANKNSLELTVARLCNNYGPRQEVTALIPQIIKNILAGQKTTLYSQGKQIRQWMHVFDTCDALLKIIAPDNASYSTYNIAANQELTNLEIFTAICTILGKGHELIEFVDKNGGRDLARGPMNVSRMKSLEWERQIKFTDGLNKTVEWYVNNPWALR